MDIISLLTGLVKPALDAVFRWKEGQDKMEVTREQFELMKKKLESDIQLQMAEEMRKPDSEFRSFVLDYEGKAEDQTPFMRNFRSSVRPIITYWALIVITAVMFGWVNGETLSKNLGAVPEPLWQIFLAIFGFWFGGRAIQQIAEAWKKGDTDKQAESVRGEMEIKKLELAKAQAEKEAAQAAAKAQTPTRADAKTRASSFNFPWDDQPW